MKTPNPYIRLLNRFIDEADAHQAARRPAPEPEPEPASGWASVTQVMDADEWPLDEWEPYRPPAPAETRNTQP